LEGALSQSNPAQASGTLDGRSIVVVGGTSGIGLCAAARFLREGARVVALGLSGPTVASAQEVLGSSALVLGGNATLSDTVPKAIAAAMRTFGRFDALYHVAGGSGRAWGDGALHDVSDEAWRATLDLNLTSVFLSNRAAVRQFLSQRGGGAILNMGSVLASSPSPRHFSTLAYATAKAAIEGLSRTAAARYAADGIRINVLAAGLVDTPMSQRAAGDDRIMRFIHAKQPLDGGRIGQPADLEAAAVYFLSDASRFVTGQVLTVDGGWSVTDGAAENPAGENRPETASH
jgi:NAD(P)-dependent dehydrogenase (short-subunit alcohol dehydrogenase family)